MTAYVMNKLNTMLIQYNVFNTMNTRKRSSERAFILDELFDSTQVNRPAIEARLHGIDALEARRAAINTTVKK